MLAVRSPVFKSPVFATRVWYKYIDIESGQAHPCILKFPLKSEFWWPMFYCLLQKDIFSEFSAVHDKYIGIGLMVFSAPNM